MIFKMKLQPEPFKKIKNGEKTIECRLFDEKRQKIKVGDQIVFEKIPDLTEEIKTNVIDIYRFSVFSDLLDAYPVEQFGAQNKKTFLNQLQKYYSEDEQKKYSVVGFRIKLD